ncbi:MAG: hypothetical protein IT373_31055 [Polyangiaceae bacterium]|nr:hypothetical protein [Polyangiaceae bacterium]
MSEAVGRAFFGPRGTPHATARRSHADAPATPPATAEQPTAAPAPGTPAATRGSAFNTVLGFVATALPLVLAVWRASAGAQWRSDIAAVREEGLVSTGLGGAFTTALDQLTALLPLGTRDFRAALGSALVLGLGAHLVWRVSRLLLARALGLVRPVGAGGVPGGLELRPLPKLATLLCAVAAAAAALTPTWQAEGTVRGGAMVAVVLGLGCLERVLAATSPEVSSFGPDAARRWLVLTALLGALLAENLPAGIGVLAAVLAACAASKRRPPGRLRWHLAVLGLGALALGLAPALLRPMAPRSWSELGHALGATGLAGLDAASGALPGVFAWAHELGWVALGVAGFGVVVGLARTATRGVMAPLLVLVGADLFYPASASTALSTDPLAALRLLALAVLAVSSAVGMAELVAFLLALRVPLARTAAVLTVVFHVSIVAVSSEEAGFVSNRNGLVATEEWTDAALGSLPPSAAVLVDTPALAWRLSAAQLTRGERPDVVVLPVPLLRQGLGTGALLRREPAVSLVLRDLALTGQASEYALSVLADARPLYLELDESWPARLLTHAAPEGTWLRYRPESLGLDDRRADASGVLAPTGRLVTSLDAGPSRDRATAAVVGQALKEHAAALALLGLGAWAASTVDWLASVAPDDPFVAAARLRLDYATRARSKAGVELRDLLRY